MGSLDPPARERERDLGTLQAADDTERVADAPCTLPEKCPTCGSPQPKLHPAVQFEGEVQPCADPWHGVEKPLFEIGPFGWLCEDCHFFTQDEAAALHHSDTRKHSLARCSVTRWEQKNRTHKRRARRKRQKERNVKRISELESQLTRTLKLAASALERCEVATDPSGAADEAAALLRQVVTPDGKYVPYVKPAISEESATGQERA